MHFDARGVVEISLLTHLGVSLPPPRWMARSERHAEPKPKAIFQSGAGAQILAWRSERAIHQAAAATPS